MSCTGTSGRRKRAQRENRKKKQKREKLTFVLRPRPRKDGKACLSLVNRRRGRWEFLVLKQVVDLCNADILSFEHTI